MVILLVSPNYIERDGKPKGGVGMYMRRVAYALEEYGHTPIILSTGTENLHYVENGIEVFFIHRPALRFGTGILHMVANILYGSYVINKKISELIQAREIDIIQFSSIQSWPVFYYGKVPAIMRLSGYDKLYCIEHSDIIETYIYSFLECLAAKRCTAVFAPSNINAKAFARDIHRRVSVIESPFWNECSEYDESVYQNRIKDKKYFLFFGRLTVVKGILVIAEILEEFLHLHPEYVFVCCGIEQNRGKENLLRVLRNSAGKYKDRFIYMKTLPHELLYPIIKKADFVICPSLCENFSNACMEAMYFGRVVIGTDGASYEQLIDNGKSGLLCTPGDSKSLLQKMNEAVAMTEVQKRKMGKNARKRIDKLSPEIMVRKLIRYYQYIIDHANN